MQTDLLRKLSCKIQSLKKYQEFQNPMAASNLLQDPFGKTKSGICVRNAHTNEGFFKETGAGNESMFDNVERLLERIMSGKVDLERVLAGGLERKSWGGEEKGLGKEVVEKENVFEGGLESWKPLVLKTKISFEMDFEDSLDSEIQTTEQLSFQSQFLLNSNVISDLYDTPSPFIIIYSICILTKHLILSKKTLDPSNAGKLLLISIILAYKYSFDEPIDQINLHFSQVSGVDLHEINKLEMKYLIQMEFRSFISRQLFLQVSDLLYK